MTGDRQLVRQAVAAYFGGAQVPDDLGDYYQGGPLTQYGLGTAYPYLIKGAPADEYFTLGQPPGVQFGAIMGVKLRQMQATRTAIGGPVSGWRQKTYRVECTFMCLSMDTHLEQAEAALDTLVDQWQALLYLDRTLGTSNNTLYPNPPYFGNRLIQEAGEKPYGYTVGDSSDWFVDDARGRAWGGISITFDAPTVVQG